MDLTQAKYMVTIAEEGSLARAASKLYISTSALNQQLNSIEKEYGCNLFNHVRNKWTPTQAGKIYLEGARQQLEIQRSVLNQIHDLTKSLTSNIRIGLSPGRGIKMFTTIYPIIHKEFPDIKITPMEMHASQQQEAIQKGQIDLAFMMLTEKQKTNDSYLKIGSEEMIVIVPKIHPICELAAPPDEDLAVIDLNDLKYEPFVLMDKNSTNRALCDDIFDLYGFSPDILMETSTTSSIPDIVGSMICCGIVPRYYINPNNSKFGCFVLKEHPHWNLCISYRKNSYISEAARAFIRLSKDYWSANLVPVQTN